MRTHNLEGRKREEPVGELGNVTHHKRGLTSWRGGRGRSRLVSLETWHVTNEDSHAGGEEEGGVGGRDWKNGTEQKNSKMMEGRKGEELGREMVKEGNKKHMERCWGTM